MYFFFLLEIIWNVKKTNFGGGAPKSRGGPVRRSGQNSRRRSIVLRSKVVSRYALILPNKLILLFSASTNFLATFSVSIVIRTSLCTWHSITFLRRVCVIVLRNQVFNRLRALKLLSASHELAGDNSNRRRSFSTWGKIDFTFEGKLMITKIKGEIQYFYGTFQYISTFSIIYGQNPNFNEKNWVI